MADTEMAPGEVLGRMRGIKGKCMLRNARFQEELASVIEDRPTLDEYQTWNGERQLAFEERFNTFARKWDCDADAWSASEMPAGDPRLTPATFSELSPPHSRVLVVAIDLGHDVETLMPPLQRWITTCRRALAEERKRHAEDPPTDWQEYRYGPNGVLILEEALVVWDRWQNGEKPSAIAADLYPGDAAAGYRMILRRFKLAQQMIEGEGYRDILPLNARYRSLDWVMAFKEAGRGPDAE